MAQVTDTVRAIRGAALTYIDDPFRKPVDECFVYESDALVVMRDGEISQFGPAKDLLDDLPEGIEVTTYDNSLILPGADRKKKE